MSDQLSINSRTNPLISDFTAGTLSNSADALEFIQHSTLGVTGHKIELSEQATTGLYFLILCIQQAIEYEAERTANHGREEKE